MKRFPRIVIVFVLLAGAVTALCTWLGSIRVGIAAGLSMTVIAVLVAWSLRRQSRSDGPEDPSRRGFLAIVGVGGVLFVAGGAALGRVVQKLVRPDAAAVQEAAATDIGAEYMELVARASHPGRSAELQLLLAPFNSANYAFESQSLHPRDPRTSHAAVWMYLERVPLIAYGPGVIEPGDSTERV